MIWTTVAVWLSSSGAVPAQPATAPMQTEQTSSLLGRMRRAHEIAAALGDVGQQRGAAVQVRRFGALLAGDHGRAVHRMKEHGREQGVPLAPPDLSPPDAIAFASWTERLDDLRTIEVARFDAAFLRACGDLSRELLAVIENARTAEVKRPLRGMLDNVRPIVEQHLVIADQLGQGAAP